MKKILFMTYGESPALTCARKQLDCWGYPLTDQPDRATHILLPVPSLDEGGNVRGAGPLPSIPTDTWIFGGHLDRIDHKKVDFLNDPYYLAENAAITAQCAINRLENPATKRVLIIGMGRIGSVLAIMLQQMGATVHLAIRNPKKKQEAEQAGFHTGELFALPLKEYHCIFNTAPAPLMRQEDAASDCQLIDLASTPGILGDRVDWARALPGKEAPQASGILIAKTALRYALKKEDML